MTSRISVIGLTMMSLRSRGSRDTRRLPDGTYTLVVRANDGNYSAAASTEVTISNVTRESFVVRDGADFSLDGEPFFYVGYNAYDLPFKYPSTLASPQKTVVYTTTGERLYEVQKSGTTLSPRQLVDREIIEAKKLGMNVVRTWAFNNDLGDAHSYYTAAWGFNEAQFKNLDYVMESARKHHVKVILTLQNYWQDYGGIAAVAKRFGLNKLEYFSDPRCKQSFRDFVSFLAKRTNSVNGRTYRDDPTLFAWELMNEPRMDKNDDPTSDQHLFDPTGAKLGAWMNEMSSFIKSVDPKHLVGPVRKAMALPAGAVARKATAPIRLRSWISRTSTSLPSTRT